MTIQYADRWLRLIGVPFIALFNRHLGDPTALLELLKKKEYYLDISAYLLISFLIWELNRFLIRYFDRQYNWLLTPFKRLILQASVNLGLSGLLLTVTIFLYQILIMHRQEGFYIEYLFASDVPIGLLFVLIINLVYGLYALIQLYESRIQQVEHQLLNPHNESISSPEKEKPVKKNLVVSKGSSLVPLPTDEIAYIYKANDYNFVKTFDQQEYMIDHTLEQLAQQLSETGFYRINRQMIASIDAIKQVHPKEQGGFVLQLQPGFSEEVTVSKKKAVDFKDWIDR